MFRTVLNNFKKEFKMENQITTITVTFDDLSIGINEYENVNDFFEESDGYVVCDEVHKQEVIENIKNIFEQFDQDEDVIECEENVCDMIEQVDENKFKFLFDQDDEQVTVTIIDCDVFEQYKEMSEQM